MIAKGLGIPLPPKPRDIHIYVKFRDEANQLPSRFHGHLSMTPMRSHAWPWSEETYLMMSAAC